MRYTYWKCHVGMRAADTTPHAPIIMYLNRYAYDDMANATVPSP